MRQRHLSAFVLGLALSVAVGSAAPTYAQDAPVSMPSGEPKKDINDTPPVNPLQGLFQMQPQYPTPGTTQMFPEAVPSHMGSDANVQGRNPGTSSSTFQQPFKDSNPKPEEKIERTDNGLKGLFQMQPQYPTPGTTQMFPEATPKFLGDDSSVQGRQPGSASNTYSVPWKDPYAAPAAKSEDKTDYLKDLFQMQPQYPSPGATTMFPTATSPQYGPDGNKPGQQPGTAGELYKAPDNSNTTADIAPIMPNSVPSGQAGEGAKDSEKKDGDGASDKKDGADSDKKDAEKKDGDDKKDADKKDGDKKDDDKKDDDADKKDADKKDGDKKAADKKDDSEKPVKDADKKDVKDSDKKDGKSADKKDGDKKDAKDSKDGKDAKDEKDGEKKEEVKYLPFNPIRESITLLNANRLPESLDLLNREIKKNPKNSQAFYIRAMVQVKMRQYDKAAADYNEVLRLSPTGDLASRAKMGLTKIRF